MKKTEFALATLVALGAATTSLASGTDGKHLADGTNVWIGAASGGSMKTLSNWKAVIKGVEYADATSVSNLFMQHVALDLRGLANGAVLTNDIAFGNTYKERDSGAYTMLAGLIASGAASDTWTMVNSGGKGLYFCSPCYLTVEGGTLNFGAGVNGVFYPKKLPKKYGSGRLRFTAPIYFWEDRATVAEGTLAFTNGVGSSTYSWNVADGARIDIEKGTSSIGQIRSASTAANAILNVNADATLDLCTGFNTFDSWQYFYGDLTGAGIVRATGGFSPEFRAAGGRTALSFAGTLQPYAGDLVFGTASAPLGVSPSASVDVDGAANVRLYADQTVARLSGVGSDGAIALAGKTLTVTGPAGAQTNTFAGRIVAKDFVKQGADYTLALSGASLYTGETRVEAGTLALKRSATRKGLLAYWSFDDADDMGMDNAPDGLLPLSIRVNDLTFRPYSITDGVSGRAVHFGDGKSTLKGGAFLRANTTNLNAAGILPKNASQAFTFRFWMRPNKKLCGNGANFVRMGSVNGNYTNELGNITHASGWDGFFFGSVKWDETKGKTGSQLGAFENLAFYMYNGWTRGGVWDDGGSTKVADGYVVIAKFAEKFGDKNYLCDGAWHQIVATYSNRVMRLFVDGVKMDERTRKKDFSFQSNPYFAFGSYSATDSAHSYQGGIDEAQLCAGAWSEAEVLADYQAKNRVPAEPLLPEPIAHWTFASQTADHGYADVTGHGYDLVNVPSNASVAASYVQSEAVTYPDDATAVGHAARTPCKGCALKLADGVSFTDRLPEGGSFTLAMRSASPCTSIYFELGNGTAANSVRLCDDECPRRQHWYFGSTGYTSFNDTGIYNGGNSPVASTYVTTVIVYDAPRKTRRVYRDGKLIDINTDTTLVLKAKTFKWTGGAINLRLDDLRLYNEPLTSAQVATLARCIRYGETLGDAAAEAMPVIPSNSTVTVAAGATLEAQGTAGHSVKALAGAGTVRVRGASAFAAADYAGFTGKVVGSGTLRVAQGQTVPLAAAQIEADVGFEDDTIVLNAATRDVPLVKTAGRVVLPKAGTIRLADATSPFDFCGKTFVIAECASAEIPADLSGWTFVPASTETPRLSFRFANGKLTACFGGGSAVILR